MAGQRVWCNRSAPPLTTQQGRSQFGDTRCPSVFIFIYKPTSAAPAEGCSRRVLLNKRAVCLIILLHFAAIEAQPDRNICTDIIIIHVTPEAARGGISGEQIAHTQTHAPQARQGRAFFRPFLCSNPNCCLSTRCKYKKKGAGGCGRRRLYLHVGKLFWFRLKSCSAGKSTSDWIGARGFLDLFSRIVFAQRIHK